MFDRSAIRSGFVTIETLPSGQISLKGIPVLGYGRSGSRNRTVLISKEAPGWFKELCAKYAGTAFQIRAQVTSVMGGELAFAVPCTQTPEEALSEWQERNAQRRSKIEMIEAANPVSIADGGQRDWAIQAHMHYASKKGLAVVEHITTPTSIHTVVRNDDGELFHLYGGVIVHKVRHRIQSGLTTMDKEVERFVRIRPHF